jgi:FkbM family methyltransferase
VRFASPLRDPSPRDSLFSSQRLRAILGDRPVIIVDGGARGGVTPPLDRIATNRRVVVRFEPDLGATVDTGPSEKVLRKALWSAPGSVELHLTRERSCSSIYPPDTSLLSRFIDVLGPSGRHVDECVEVPATSIDEALGAAHLGLPDFIKLDIHGAEYEALVGASEALANQTVGVLVESWQVPIHRGQHPASQLDGLLQNLGFRPFQTAIGSWPLKPARPARYVSRPQDVQLETLYFLDFLDDSSSTPSRARIVLLVGFAELFGHVSYAVQLVRFAARKGLITDAEGFALESDILARNRISPSRLILSACAERLRNALDRVIVPVAGR